MNIQQEDGINCAGCDGLSSVPMGSIPRPEPLISPSPTSGVSLELAVQKLREDLGHSFAAVKEIAKSDPGTRIERRLAGPRGPLIWTDEAGKTISELPKGQQLLIEQHRNGEHIEPSYRLFNTREGAVSALLSAALKQEHGELHYSEEGNFAASVNSGNDYFSLIASTNAALVDIAVAMGESRVARIRLVDGKARLTPHNPGANLLGPSQ